MSFPTMPLLTLVLTGTVLGLAGCTSSRPDGDPTGSLIPFAVDLDAAFLSRMSDHRVGVTTGLGLGFGTGGGSGLGGGLGIGYQETTVYLLGGDHPAEAGAFRRKLRRGRNNFAVQLAPGHHLVLTIQAEGGRQGWETVGDFTVASPDADQVDLTLGAQGAMLKVH